MKQAVLIGAVLLRRMRAVWRRPWPLTARVPIVSGALILAVAVAVSHVMMSTIGDEQELGVRRLAAVYLDGISTTIYPHVFARNLANTTEALRRTMWFHQSMREQRAMVRLPDGSLFADVSGPNGDSNAEDPFHDAGLRARLERGDGFVFDADSGTGWASRAIVRDGNHVADLYVALELKPLIDERHTLRRKLLVATVLCRARCCCDRFPDCAAHGIAGSLADRTTCAAPRPAISTLCRPPCCRRHRVSMAACCGATTTSWRHSASGRPWRPDWRNASARACWAGLPPLVAHEVRNPLGGMSTALDTVRKFGDDPKVRVKALDLIERGLWSIRDVVGSVLAFHRMPPDSRRLAQGDLDDLRHPDRARTGSSAAPIVLAQ